MWELDQALQQLSWHKRLRSNPGRYDPVGDTRLGVRKRLSGSRAALRTVAQIHMRGCIRRGDVLPEDLDRKLDEWLRLSTRT